MAIMPWRCWKIRSNINLNHMFNSMVNFIWIPTWSQVISEDRHSFFHIGYHRERCCDFCWGELNDSGKKTHYTNALGKNLLIVFIMKKLALDFLYECTKRDHDIDVETRLEETSWIPELSILILSAAKISSNPFLMDMCLALTVFISFPRSLFPFSLCFCSFALLHKPCSFKLLLW